MTSPLGAVYSGIDTAKRKAAAFVEDMVDVGPVEMLRQMAVNRANASAEASAKLGELYKDAQGQPTFDPNRWSPTAAAVHDELAGESLGGVMGATAWHGSPHIIDKFRKEKIGTGEGAQAKGYGHYSGSQRGVGEFYADSVTGYHNEQRGPISVGGRKFDPDNPAHNAASAIDNNRGRVNDAVHELWDAYVNRGKYDKGDRLTQQQAQAAIDHLRRYGGVNLPKVTINEPLQKNLYKLDIPDPHIARMLDWDKALLEQQPQVIEMLGWKGGRGLLDDMQWEARHGSYGRANKIGKEGGIPDPMITGGMLHQQLQNQLGSEQAASAALAAKGMSGAKHLDSLSNKARGSLTQNYVVFPEYEDIIKILGRETLPADQPWSR